MATIPGEKVLITDVDVFVDEDGYIRIYQEPDPMFTTEPDVVVLDVRRARLVAEALLSLLAPQASEGP